MRISDVMRETGLSRTSITILYKVTAQKVDPEVLDKPFGLFDCQVGELLELVPSSTN
jgi:putative transcriptional regulator